MPTALLDIHGKVHAGEALSDADAHAILATTDIVTLGMLADDVRRRIHGDRATFVRVADVALDGPLPAGALLEAAGEIRIAGAPRTVDEACARVAEVAAVAGHVPVSGFSLADLETCCAREPLTLVEGLVRLREAGLGLIAEAPLDGLGDADAAFGAAGEANLPIARVTLRTDPDTDTRIALLRRLERLDLAQGPLPVFAPLARHPLLESDPPTGYDDVKQVVLARLLLTRIPCMQVDWVRCGAKLAQVALAFGADDLDSVPAAPGTEQGPRRATLEEIRRNIRAASLVPVERNGRFEVIDP